MDDDGNRVFWVHGVAAGVISSLSVIFEEVTRQRDTGEGLFKLAVASCLAWGDFQAADVLLEPGQARGRGVQGGAMLDASSARKHEYALHRLIDACLNLFN